jgi:hypothetical protein
MNDGGFVEIIAYEAEVPLGVELLAVVADDAGGFLASVLERVQPEGCDGRGFGVSKYTEDSAFLSESVVAHP